VADSTWAAALAYCKKRRALLLVDAPASWTTKDSAVTGARSFALARHENAALFFPRIRAADRYFENRLESFAPAARWPACCLHRTRTRGI
jgi:hypothetical protein